jgi:hypothetical protein
MPHDSRTDRRRALRIANADSARAATLVRSEPSEDSPEARRAATLAEQQGRSASSPRETVPAAVELALDVRVQTILYHTLPSPVQAALRGGPPASGPARARPKERSAVSIDVLTPETDENERRR